MYEKIIMNSLEEGVEKLSKAMISEKKGKTAIKHAPFFSAFTFKNLGSADIEISNGAFFHKKIFSDYKKLGRVDVRMGDYDEGSYGEAEFNLPLNMDKKAVRIELADASNDAFWESVADMEEKYSASLGFDNDDEYKSFSREKKEFYSEENNKHIPDMEEYADMLRKLSSDIKHPNLLDVSVGLHSHHEERYFVNSEGTRIFTNSLRHNLYIKLDAIDKSQRIINVMEHFHTLDFSKLPDYENLMKTGEMLKINLFQILKAPIQRNGNFPVLMDQENHGVLWHEMIGHSLEGHRMQEDEMGDKTTLFLNRIGEKVGPEFISVFDDPRINELDAHYLYDEEGVRAKKADLIKKGILKGYMHSRESAGYFNKRSNGHARSEDLNKPEARMSNLIVKSTNERNYDELLEELMKITKDRGKEYGLIFERSNGGLTLPEDCFFQSFPEHVFRLYPDGTKKRVRGIYVVGTPETVLNSIVMTGDDYKLFNGFCGSGSGSISSTEVAPHALLSSLDVNSIPNSSYALLRKRVVFP